MAQIATALLEFSDVGTIVDAYRRKWPRLTSVETRREKAEKIRAVLRSYLHRDLKELVCFDLGCGAGIISAALSPHFSKTLACDLDSEGIAFAQTMFRETEAQYFVADATQVPLPDHSCDVIICCHVYEHVASAFGLVRELERLLKPDGVCYFSGPNAWRVFEPHLRLPFIHWLPRPLTNSVLRCLGRPPYEEHLRTRGDLASLLTNFRMVDLNPQLVREPERFHTLGEPGICYARFIPPVVRDPLLRVFAPSFNFLLFPKGNDDL